jgi:hypothetical protein
MPGLASAFLISSLVMGGVKALTSGISAGVQGAQAARARRESMIAEDIIDSQAKQRREILESNLQAQQIEDKNLATDISLADRARNQRLQDQAVGERKAEITQFNLDELGTGANKRAQTVANVSALRGF